MVRISAQLDGGEGQAQNGKPSDEAIYMHGDDGTLESDGQEEKIVIAYMSTTTPQRIHFISCLPKSNLVGHRQTTTSHWHKIT
jgi:hypothetical protein